MVLRISIFQAGRVGNSGLYYVLCDKGCLTADGALAPRSSACQNTHLGKLRLETAEAKADRIVNEELGRLNWKEIDLRSRRKGAPAKLAMAARLRRETTLSSKAIASRVHLGTSKSGNIRLHTAMRLTAPAETAQGTFGL